MAVLASLACVGRLVAQQPEQTESARPKPQVFQETIQPFLRQNCVRCHGVREANADIRLDTLLPNFSDKVTAQHWKSVMDAINVGAMPPDDEKQPSV
ncbi:MAG: hypothetical protein KDA84_06130, partial [Planctomycetaceae bacterium]|nr:hypothetical protein [Planctomycetaceae bacterium]